MHGRNNRLYQIDDECRAHDCKHFLIQSTIALGIPFLADLLRAFCRGCLGCSGINPALLCNNHGQTSLEKGK
jgi:hypothetical protein